MVYGGARCPRQCGLLDLSPLWGSRSRCPNQSSVLDQPPVRGSRFPCFIQYGLMDQPADHYTPPGEQFCTLGYSRGLRTGSQDWHPAWARPVWWCKCRLTLHSCTHFFALELFLTQNRKERRRRHLLRTPSRLVTFEWEQTLSVTLSIFSRSPPPPVIAAGRHDPWPPFLAWTAVYSCFFARHNDSEEQLSHPPRARSLSGRPARLRDSFTSGPW